MQLRYGLVEYIDISTRLEKSAETSCGCDRLANLDAALEKYAWDGAWYLRAYRYDGLKFGSHENEEGEIS